MNVKPNFPIFTTHPDLIYLDNAATSHKPQVVIDAITQYYTQSNANVHRGVHKLSDASTTAWEEAHQQVANFLGAEPAEFIQTRNATEAVNGLAYGWGLQNIQANDVIITSLLEHHANVVPWQKLAEQIQAKLAFAQVTDTGKIDLNHLESLLQEHGPKVRLVTLTHVSNVTGAVLPVPEVVALCQKYSSSEKPIRIMLDACQSVPHLPFDFKKLNIDFAVFSGHKMLGPMGAGGLLVRKNILESGEMQPWLFGGGMIGSVSTKSTSYNDDLIERFTAGTPDVASLVGLASACTYLNEIGMEKVAEHSQSLVHEAYKLLENDGRVQLVGPQPADRVGSVAFIYPGVHAHDVAQIFDSFGIAVRSGHHCCMPLHTDQGWQATVRLSFQVYNQVSELEKIIPALDKVQQVFKA